MHSSDELISKIYLTGFFMFKKNMKKCFPDSNIISLLTYFIVKVDLIFTFIFTVKITQI